MNIENLFQIASRNRFRFESKVGVALLTVEDLWSLPMKSNTKASLDGVAIELSRQLKGSEESFVTEAAIDKTIEQKFELVKYIIQVRLNEIRDGLAKQARAAQRELIEDLIDRKKNESLSNLSLEELEAMKAGL